MLSPLPSRLRRFGRRHFSVAVSVCSARLKLCDGKCFMAQAEAIDALKVFSRLLQGCCMPKPSAMERAIRHLEANWREGKTLKEVADLYHVDSGNLERAFRKREGMTVKQFVDQKRKAHVVSRLTKKTVFGYEIGAELGFADELAFYRWVRRAFGVSFTKLRSQLVTIRQQKKHDKK